MDNQYVGSGVVDMVLQHELSIIWTTNLENMKSGQVIWKTCNLDK